MLAPRVPDQGYSKRGAQDLLDAMLITVRCPGCNRKVHYWVADLLQVLGDRRLDEPPFPCSRCNSRELDVKWRVPAPSELSDLTVRRPARQVVRWIWRNEKA